MTEQECKRIQDQIWDLQSQINHYKEDQLAINIIKEENRILGKAYKHEKDGITYYYKPLSLLTGSSFYVLCLVFCIPLNVKLKPAFKLVYENEFDYQFSEKDFFFIRKERTNNFNTYYTEISINEYEAALANAILKVTEFSRKKFLLKDVKGEEYAKKIEQYILQEGSSVENIPQEN